ncbi:MAG: hypothetical protein M1822_002688 [Bathelium mastoideum]|nr:MAG: hypothetical protein M1822_002688 [Bathelium mastoideum]
MFHPDGPKTASLAKACLSCRSRHLKCSGGDPCTRCRSEGDTCTYVKSRRGYKGPRKTKRALSTHSNSPVDRQPQQDLPHLSRSNSQLSASDSLGMNEHGVSSSKFFASHSDMGPATNQAGGLNDLAHSDTFNAFFRTFYLDHPYILPRDYTIQLLRKKPLPHLELAIHFIGSHYVSRSSSSRYGDALTNCLAQQTLPRDGFMVQTLLLFFTGLHLANEGQRSERYLDSAISLALELGMNLANFSQHSSENNPVMEESWRRTWWELYIADGLGASFSQSRPYGLWSVPCNVTLPCEDTSFFSGVSIFPFSA